MCEPFRPSFRLEEYFPGLTGDENTMVSGSLRSVPRSCWELVVVLATVLHFVCVGCRALVPLSKPSGPCPKGKTLKGGTYCWPKMKFDIGVVSQDDKFSKCCKLCPETFEQQLNLLEISAEHKHAAYQRFQLAHASRQRRRYDNPLGTLGPDVEALIPCCQVCAEQFLEPNALQDVASVSFLQLADRETAASRRKGGGRSQKAKKSKSSGRAKKKVPASSKKSSSKAKKKPASSKKSSSKAKKAKKSSKSEGGS